jgi:hypothetical protein
MNNIIGDNEELQTGLVNERCICACPISILTTLGSRFRFTASYL